MTKNLVSCGKVAGWRRYVGLSISDRLLPIPTGRKNADGLLGDAHDMAHVLIVHAHIVEKMEENLSLAVKFLKDFTPLHSQIHRTVE